MSIKRFFHRGALAGASQATLLSSATGPKETLSTDSKASDNKESWIALDKEAANHARVCRMREGESMELLDGHGNYWRGVFERGGLRVAEKGALPPEPTPITLVVGFTQGGTFDLILRQATEMAVAAIIPFWSEFGSPRLEQKRLLSKKDRWEKIAEEACKQSGLYYLPRIHPVVNFAEALKLTSEPKAPSLPASAQPNDPKSEAAAPVNLVAALGGSVTPWESLTLISGQPIFLWVGPEGDFSPQEYAALHTAGAKFVSLGKTVLRVETACVAGLARVKMAAGM